MKLVFAHDHKLRMIGEKYYTLGGLSDSITQRYTHLFDEMTIICRVIQKQQFDTKLFEICNPKVKVISASNGSLIISKAARKVIEKEVQNSDGVIARLHSRIGEIAIKYAIKHGIPYLVESVGCPWDAFWNYSIKGKFVAPIMYFTTKMSIKNAPYAVYVTKEFLEKRYPCKGKWIDCSDVELLCSDPNVLERRLDKIEHINKPLVLGTLAQVDVKYKGQEYVIKALSVLKNKGIIFKYKMAGSGDSARLRNIAKKYDVQELIQFCGVIQHSEVFNWLDDIDIYIQPSNQEGLPRAMIEAISRACPACGSTAGGIGELVDKEYIFSKRSVKEICTILEKLSSKDNLAEQARKNFRKSQMYRKDYLDKRRKSFYKEFADECARRKKV